jgi:hypothetical protein
MAATNTRETALLASLTAAITVLAFAGVHLGVSRPLEAVSVVTGAVCVWLTVRENVWNFPIGLANVATFCVVFFAARLPWCACAARSTIASPRRAPPLTRYSPSRTSYNH